MTIKVIELDEFMELVVKPILDKAFEEVKQELESEGIING